VVPTTSEVTQLNMVATSLGRVSTATNVDTAPPSVFRSRPVPSLAGWLVPVPVPASPVFCRAPSLPASQSGKGQTGVRLRGNRLTRGGCGAGSWVPGERRGPQGHEPGAVGVEDVASGPGNNSLWVPKTSSGLAVALGAMMAA